MPKDGSTVPKVDPATSIPFSQIDQFVRSRVALQRSAPPEAARVSYHARARLQFVRGGR
jgi:hypothetical protein